jgi:hypothetical protein
MTTAERVAALQAIQAQLLAITTTTERRDYPFAAHLSDLIDDLQLEEGE